MNEHVHRDLNSRNGKFAAVMFLIEVLYSSQSDIWKISDFGITADRSKRTTLPTEFSRGTPGYRAPELLTEYPTFSEYIDIWALGCVLFETVFRRKAFTSDWAIREYATTKRNISVPVNERPVIAHLIHQLLQVAPKARPTASQMLSIFATMVRDPSTFVEIPEAMDPDEQPYSDFKPGVGTYLQLFFGLILGMTDISLCRLIEMIFLLAAKPY